jgi:ribosomal protein S18 acetylase RimI-like enzyme
MAEVVVRRATAADAETIAVYALKLFRQHREYDERRFIEVTDLKQAAAYYSSRTKAEDAAVLVAELDDKIVGFAFVEFELKNYAALLESAAWLHDIYVDEAARRTRAGKILTEAAVEAAKELGASKLMLTVAVQNEIARNFFENAGFRTTMLEMTLDLTGQKNND